MKSFRAALAMLAIVMVTASACGSVPHGTIEYDPPFAPISIAIDSTGAVHVTANAKLVTSLGVITVKAGVAKDLHGETVPAQPEDVTQLFICRTVRGKRRCNAYQINSDRKMRITMNGKFVQDIERNRVTISAKSKSTITVTDISPTGTPTPLAHPAADIDKEDFDLSETSDDTLLDFERSEMGHRHGLPDLAYDHVTGQLRVVNGAKISRVYKYGWFASWGRDIPSEEKCKKSHKWANNFKRNDLDASIIVACIKTAEGNYGNMTIEPDEDEEPVAYDVATYTWVRR